MGHLGADEAAAYLSTCYPWCLSFIQPCVGVCIMLHLAYGLGARGEGSPADEAVCSSGDGIPTWYLTEEAGRHKGHTPL